MIAENSCHIQSGVESPPEMAEELRERRKQEKYFLEQLLDTSKLENYHVPVPIKADLRKYQQVGLQYFNWFQNIGCGGLKSVCTCAIL